MPYRAEVAFFPLADDKRYHVQIAIMRADASCMEPVQCMSNPIKMLGDPGADITLLRNEEANKLGYNLDMVYDTFPVQGIAGQPTQFKQVDTWIAIGDLEPIFAPVGFCTTPDGLYENLLGNKGLIRSGKITAHYDSRDVSYTKGMYNANFAGLR